MNNRAGEYRRCMSGEAAYTAFIPAPLPPEPPLSAEGEMTGLLLEANRRVAALEGIAARIPNVPLFVSMYVRKEALMSSQIEGTQASLIDVMNRQAEAEHGEYSRDGVKEVINYVNAMSWGLEKLNELPLSLRLIRNIHEVLLRNVRGANKSPGEFRRSQNWIGPMG